MASTKNANSRVTFSHRCEHALLLALVLGVRWLPRFVARQVGALIGLVAYRCSGRLREVGQQNLSIALPSAQEIEREGLLRQSFRHLGEHFSEFCQMSRYRPEFARGRVMRYEGLEHYEAAQQAGRGVLVLTGHLGAWELSSFVHSLLGYPMAMVIRRLDNPLLDRFVNRIRCRHGNTVLHKDDFARGLLSAMARGETVGILMDTNMTPPQGLFVPFFGVPACTASGLARVARKTDATVLPGFLLWQKEEERYVLHFGQPLTLQRTGDAEADAFANTALFARVTEDYIRRYPDQWLWMHRRWKTRPQGEKPLYSGQQPVVAAAS